MTFWSNLYASGSSRGVSVGAVENASVTPSRFRADVERTRAYVEALDRDIVAQAGQLSGPWRAGWTDFVTRWGGFVADNPAEQDLEWYTCLGYAEEARKWRTSFEAAGGHSTAVPDTAPRRPETMAPASAKASSSPFVWALLAGVLVAGWLVFRGGSEGGSE